MKIGNKFFDTQKNVYIMGILNVTPDSFSDGGNFSDIDRALFHVEKMIQYGADIIDVGGESTRPGFSPVSVAEEIERTAPVLEKIKENFDVPISLDSYKSDVVEANLQHIDLINDIWGFKHDKNMAKIVADSGLPCCLMHNHVDGNYRNFIVDHLNDIKESLKIALGAGVKRDKIILDGGVGFGKSYEQNLQVINNTELLCSLGYPVMIATSRKSVIVNTLDKITNAPLYGTLATTVVGIMKGASFVRVHDVEENYSVIKMTKSILGEQKWIN